MVKNYLNYTCLFGGGAIRGTSYVGAVKAMEELGISPTTLAGSSVGSLIAALLAVGYNAEELKEVFLKINFELFKDIQLAIGPKFALSKGEVFLVWLRELIEEKYYGKNYKKGHNKAVTFKDIDKNLVIITTDLSNFECKEFSRFETPDYEIAKAVRISSSMPGLMKPIEYNNTLLVDGDLQKSWPMWKLSKNLLVENERILEFRLEGIIEDNNEMNALDYANAVYSCMTAMATSFITDIYAKRDKFDYIVLNTGDIIIVDFNTPAEKRECLIKSGYDQTICYFNKVLPQKKNKILKHYKTVLTHLLTIRKYIENNKILKAKIRLGELFTDLCEISTLIDCSFYSDLKVFKDEFNENINYPALFGRVLINNEKLILTDLARIINNVQLKISELEDYLIAFPVENS